MEAAWVRKDKWAELEGRGGTARLKYGDGSVKDGT